MCSPSDQSWKGTVNVKDNLGNLVFITCTSKSEASVSYQLVTKPLPHQPLLVRRFVGYLSLSDADHSVHSVASYND